MDELKNAQAALDEANDLLKMQAPPSVLHVTEHTTLAAKYLTPEAVAAMSGPKATRLMLVTKDGLVAKCLYFSCIVETERIEAGVEAMAKIANDMAAKGQIHSVLAPISSIELSIEGLKLPHAVFLFILVPAAHIAELEQHEYHNLEGAIGKRLP